MALSQDQSIIGAYQLVFGTAPSNALYTTAGSFYAANGAASWANLVTSVTAGYSNADLAAVVVENAGITGRADLVEYVSELFAIYGADQRGAVILALSEKLSSFEGDATFGAYATSYNSTLAANTDVAKQPTPGETYDLTAQQDSLTGTSLADTFYAYIFDNQNTLQSGDRINGGAGEDTLYADVGNSQAFAITPILNSVENVIFRAQAIHSDAADNNLSGADLAQLLAVGADVGSDVAAAYLLQNFRGSQVDAERSVGVNHWESNKSRADLIIEDVNILDSQITRDVTVAFTHSDPGNVDFGVYFNPHSLRAAGVDSTTALTLSIYNPLSSSPRSGPPFDPANPLNNVPYDQLTIEVNGKQITIHLDLQNVTTYDQLYEALVKGFADAVPANPELASGHVDRIKDGQSFFSVDGEPRTADVFVLTLDGYQLSPAPNGWGASGGLPSTNAFAATVDQGVPVVVEALITSTVILDDVGSGSTGGDLVIGSQSTGETSASRGVEQFDITVENSSKLQAISSTHNTLEVVNFVNGTVKGDITVLGAVYAAGFGGNLSDYQNDYHFGYFGDLGRGDLVGDLGKYVNPLTSGDLPLAGAIETGNGFGFTDVRVINASAFEGKTAFSVLLTDEVAQKYLDLHDNQAAPADDNVNFSYSLGQNDDTFAIQIDEANLAYAGGTSREDFNLVIDGGAGNDTIFARVGADAGLADQDSVSGQIANVFGYADVADPSGNWYTNSKYNANLAITAGDGNDTVHTYGTGDWFVDLGAGNDTYYADNTGDKAVWVLNTAANAAAAAAGADLNNLVSDANNSYAIYKGQLSVTLTVGDSEYTTKTVTIPNGANVRTTDLNVNQAIKEAINTDPVLSKLLVVTDGPANTLVVTSLTDGVHAAGDLEINVAAPAAGQLTAADVAVWNSGYGAGSVADVNGLVNAINAGVAAFEARTDYHAVLGQDGGADVAGSVSINQADNRIIGGAGDDVIVLATNVDLDHGAVADAGAAAGTSPLATSVLDGLGSNDTLVYQGFNNGTDTIVNFTAGAASVAGVDFIDFFSYGVNSVEVVSGLTNGDAATAGTFNNALASFSTSGVAGAELFGAPVAASNDSFIRLVENVGNTGVYTIQLVTHGANAAATSDDSIQLVGVVNFGHSLTGDFSADTFGLN